MAEILTFDHDPVAMVRHELEKLGDEPMRGAIVIFVDREGKLLWNGAGYSNMELLWALERFKTRLLDGSWP